MDLNLIGLYFLNNLSGHIKWLDSIMIFIAVYSPFLYAGLLVIQWFIGDDGNKKIVMNATMAAVIALLINMIISGVYFEPRPFVRHKVNQLIKHSADASFPSDHSSLANSLAFMELMYRKGIGIFMMIFAVLVMIARVYAGVHYPGDVIGGFAIGFISSRIVGYTNKYIVSIEDRLILVYKKITRNYL